MNIETQQIPQKPLRYHIYHMIDRYGDAVFRFKYQWGLLWRWGKVHKGYYDNDWWEIAEADSRDKIMEEIEKHSKESRRKAFIRSTPARRVVEIEEITQ